MKKEKLSAGILVYRKSGKSFSVLLVHPGGPLWAKKDVGAWSIPKGGFEPEEEPFEAAKREFYEETGCRVTGSVADFIELTPQKQKSGKTVFCFAVEGNVDASRMHSNMFEMEWPIKSGLTQLFPEVDRAEWFTAGIGLNKIQEGQRGFILELSVRTGLAIEPVDEHGQLNLFSF
jgi:predicted NUDIX family NTP pyrophosphohydrolase